MLTFTSKGEVNDGYETNSRKRRELQLTGL